VGIDDSGAFVVVWNSNLQDSSSYGVYSRRYDAAGLAQDVQDVRINETITGNQGFPVVVMDSDGEFTVAWHSGNNQDGNSYGVYALRYGATAVAAPQVLHGQFIWQYFPQRIEFCFDSDVSASLDDGDLILENLTTATTIDAGQIVREWIPNSNMVRYTFPSLLGGALPNGHYRATLVAAGIDAGAAPLAQDYVLSFFFVNGDADHNGVVDVNDLGLLASNWQQPTEGSYTLGDFDYSGTVDVNDLGILASNWQFNLGPPPALASAITARKTTTKTPAPASNQAATIVEATRRPAARR
jgi:hypothetical protein